MSIEKSCGIMVYHSLEKEQKFLLLQSRINNHWSFPKGHMEIGGDRKRDSYSRSIRGNRFTPISSRGVQNVLSLQIGKW